MGFGSSPVVVSSLQLYSKSPTLSALPANPFWRRYCIKALVEAGANVNFRDDQNSSSLIEAAYLNKYETMQVLMEHGADVNAADRYENTALLITARRANADMVETLLARGANFNTSDNNGRTVLLLALDSPKYSDIPISKKVMRRLVACLLRHGASVQGRDTEGDTVLSLAARFHDKQVIHMLNAAGAKEQP
jgi:ankyrin repeat protein